PYHCVVDDALQSGDRILKHRGPGQLPHRRRNRAVHDGAIEFAHGFLSEIGHDSFQCGIYGASETIAAAFALTGGPADILGIVRNFLALALLYGGLCAQAPPAQPALTRILADELNRNFTALKEKGQPAPYFMGYEVTDSESNQVYASQGALNGESHNHLR